MPKINQEEYEILKRLINRIRKAKGFIARDEDGMLYAHRVKPRRYTNGCWVDGYRKVGIEIDLFQFIQWEDEEPYLIAELIEEYEEHEFYEYVGWKHYKKEEAEVKKDIEWFMEQMKSMTKMRDPDREPESWYISEGALLEALDQLDEPEVLSLEWIDKHKHYYPVTAFNNSAKEIVDVEDLQNLLVPKQELPVIPKFVADWYENHKDNLEKQLQGIAFNLDKYGKMPEVNGLDKWINETECPMQTLASLKFGYEVEEEQKYYLKIGNLYLAEPLGDMTSDIVRMTRDAEVAYRFTDRSSINTHLEKFEGTKAVRVKEL